MGCHPIRSQKTSKGATEVQPQMMEGKKKEPEEDSNKDGTDSSGSGDGSNISSGKEDDSEDGNDGSEGSVDNPKCYPPKVNVTQKTPWMAAGFIPQPTTRGRMKSRCGQTMSQMACSIGDFATPWMMEHQAMYAAVHRTAITRIFISLGLANNIVDAIVDKQDYHTLQALSCLDKEGIEMLV